MRPQSRDGSLSARGNGRRGRLAADAPAEDPSLTGSDSAKDKRLVFVDKRGEGLWLSASRVLGVTMRSCSLTANIAYTAFCYEHSAKAAVASQPICFLGGAGGARGERRNNKGCGDHRAGEIARGV